MRQFELIQIEVKRITDSRDSVVEEKEKLEQRTIQYQRELQRVSDTNVITEKNMVRSTKENLALDYTASRKEKEVFALKKAIKRLEESAKENSQKAGVRAKAENASQQNVFSRKIDDMARTNDETLAKYVAQITTLHAEVLRLQNRQANSSEARSSQDVTAPNPKREVSVASTARSMSPGTTQVILTAIERMEQRISGLSEKVDKSDERASSGRPLEVDRSPGELRMNPMMGMTALTTASTAQTVTSSKETLQGKVMTLQVRRTDIRLGLTSTP